MKAAAPYHVAEAELIAQGVLSPAKVLCGPRVSNYGRVGRSQVPSVPVTLSQPGPTGRGGMVAWEALRDVGTVLLKGTLLG